MLAPARSRSAVFFGSAGPGLRSQGNSREGGLFALCAMGSVPPIYTKGDTLYSVVVVAGAPRDRASARRETRGRRSFRAVREGGFDRFQCLLRPDPAAAVFFWLRGRWAKSQGRGRSKGVLVDCVWSSEGGGVRVVCGWWGSLGSAPRGPSCRIYPGTFSKELGH